MTHTIPTSRLDWMSWAGRGAMGTMESMTQTTSDLACRIANPSFLLLLLLNITIIVFIKSHNLSHETIFIRRCNYDNETMWR